MNTIVSSFLDTLFPSYCLGCEVLLIGNTVVCDLCIGKIPFLNYLYETSEERFIIGAAVSYEEKLVQDLIKELKFQHRRVAALPLSTLLIQYLEIAIRPPNTSFIIPLPLGKRRLRERGFNQSSLLANHIAHHFSLPVLDLLIRSRETRPQSSMSGVERSSNVEGCFTAVKHAKINNAHSLILIDDVTTSGATFFEAVKALRMLYSCPIIAVAVAKA